MRSPAEQLISFAGRHRFAVMLVLVLLGLLAGLSLLRIRFTNDVSQLFPDSQDAATTFRILNETKLGNTVQLEFISTESVEKHEKYLDAAAEKITRLPGVKNLVFRYRGADVLDEMGAFTSLLPRFYGPEILKECDPESAARNALKQLAFPMPGGVRRIRNQPFGLEMKILLPLRRMDHLTGMDLSYDVPYFATQDKRRAMMVFDADVMLGDAETVRKLLAGIRTAVEPLPPGMEYRIISGAMHTLGNEEVLKRDASISGTVSLLLFLLIFLFFCRRDWRSLWIPAIPLYASFLSLGVMTLFFREICLYVVGLGSCVTGLAVDQGIHVYSACRGKDSVGRTAALAEPMLLSALTSILVFVFLALTGIRAYIQLAFFAGLSLAISCIIALIVLPQLLDPDRTIREFAFPLPSIKSIPAWGILLLAIPAAWGLFYVLPGNADFSLDSLDGTPDATRQQEKDFNAAWRRRDAPSTAVLAVSDSSREQVLIRMQEISRRLTENKIIHSGPPVPPQSEQIASRKLWRTPAAAEAIAALEKRTREACRRHRLPDRFFQPFFDQLRAAVASDDLTVPPMLDAVMKKMVKDHPGGASAVALLPEPDPEQMPKIREILKKSGGGHCALLSKGYFRMMIRSELGGKFLWLMPLSIASALLLAFAVFRRVSDVLLAMTPVFVSFCGLFILGSLTGFKATPAAAFALILLTGLAIDYGIYAVSQLRHPEKISARNSVFLSAATTVAGAGALVFSRHPALFGTGVVLSVGIALACLAGLYLVPLMKKGKTSSMLPLLMLALLMLNGCVSDKIESVPVDADRLPQYPQKTFRLQGNAVIRWRDQEHSVILAAELDPAGGQVKAAGVSPGSGMLIFRVDDTHANDRWTIFQPGMSPVRMAKLRTDAPSFSERAEDFFLYPVRRCAAWYRERRAEEINRRLSRALIEDFRRIFLLKIGNGLAGEDKGEYIALHEKDGTEWQIRSDRTLHRNGSAWDCEYRDRGRTVLYRNLDRDYSIRIQVMKLAEKEGIR